MRTKLLPYYFKKIGLAIFFAGFIMSFLTTGINAFVDGFNEGYNTQQKEYGSEIQLEDISDNAASEQIISYGLGLSTGWVRFFDLCVYLGMLIYALSKEKKEDEFFHILRLESFWLSMVICLFILLLIHLFKGEIQIGTSFIISIPLILYLILHHFRKQIIMEV